MAFKDVIAVLLIIVLILAAIVLAALVWRRRPRFGGADEEKHELPPLRRPMPDDSDDDDLSPLPIGLPALARASSRASSPTPSGTDEAREEINDDDEEDLFGLFDEINADDEEGDKEEVEESEIVGGVPIFVDDAAFREKLRGQTEHTQKVYAVFNGCVPDEPKYEALRAAFKTLVDSIEGVAVENPGADDVPPEAGEKFKLCAEAYKNFNRVRRGLTKPDKPDGEVPETDQKIGSLGVHLPLPYACKLEHEKLKPWCAKIIKPLLRNYRIVRDTGKKRNQPFIKDPLSQNDVTVFNILRIAEELSKPFKFEDVERRVEEIKAKVHEYCAKLISIKPAPYTKNADGTDSAEEVAFVAFIDAASSALSHMSFALWPFNITYDKMVKMINTKAATRPWRANAYAVLSNLYYSLNGARYKKVSIDGDPNKETLEEGDHSEPGIVYRLRTLCSELGDVQSEEGQENLRLIKEIGGQMAIVMRKFQEMAVLFNNYTCKSEKDMSKALKDRNSFLRCMFELKNILNDPEHPLSQIEDPRLSTALDDACASMSFNYDYLMHPCRLLAPTGDAYTTNRKQCASWQGACRYYAAASFINDIEFDKKMTSVSLNLSKGDIWQARLVAETIKFKHPTVFVLVADTFYNNLFWKIDDFMKSFPVFEGTPAARSPSPVTHTVTTETGSLIRPLVPSGALAPTVITPYGLSPPAAYSPPHSRAPSPHRDSTSTSHTGSPSGVPPSGSPKGPSVPPSVPSVPSMVPPPSVPSVPSVPSMPPMVPPPSVPPSGQAVADAISGKPSATDATPHSTYILEASSHGELDSMIVRTMSQMGRGFGLIVSEPGDMVALYKAVSIVLGLPPPADIAARVGDRKRGAKGWLYEIVKYGDGTYYTKLHTYIDPEKYYIDIQ